MIEAVMAVGAAMAAIGAAYLGFLSRRADRKLSEIESVVVTIAGLRERVRSHDESIVGLRSESHEVRNMMIGIREELAYIRATLERS